MSYVKKYLVRIYNDNGDLLEFANYGSYKQKVMSISIDRQNKIGIMKLTLDNKDESYDNNFLNLNRVEVYLHYDDIPVKRFSGTVEENIPNSNNTYVTLSCNDNNGILSRRNIVGTWSDIDLGLLVKTVLQEKCPEIDVSLINISTGEVLDLVQSASLKVADFFDDVFNESNYNLYIDDNMVAQFYETRGASKIFVVDTISNDSDTSSEDIIIDSIDTEIDDFEDIELLGYLGTIKDECLLLKGTLGLRKSNVSKINTITVIGGNEQIDDFVENFTHTGSKNFPLRYKVSNVNPDYVNVNGVPISQTTDYDLSQGRTLLHITSTLITGDEIEIKYTADNPIWWREQDPSVLSTNIREETITDPTILTLERAQSLAVATLAKNSTMITKGPLSVINVNTSFAKGQTLELSLSAFVGLYEINGYTENIGDTYIVDFVLNQKLDLSTKKIYDLIKSLTKLSNTSQQIESIRDGFTLSDTANVTEELEGYESDFGDAFMINDEVQGLINDTVYQINGTYGTENKFL